MKTKFALWFIALAVVFGSAAIAQKTTDPPTNAPLGVPTPAFGATDETVVSVGSHDFSVWEPGGGATNADSNAWRWMTAGTNRIFMAGIDVPSGVTITGIGLYYCDNTAAGAFNVILWDFYGNMLFNQVASFTAPDAVPCQWAYSPAVTYQFDSNGGHFLEFYIFQTGTAVAGEIKFKAAQVHYRRKVSPGPATATFLDVPTTHPFFKFVEALYASGITAGCGSGNFCPDANVTRGQMAVFLSAALGLHFPN